MLISSFSSKKLIILGTPARTHYSASHLVTLTELRSSGRAYYSKPFAKFVIMAWYLENGVTMCFSFAMNMKAEGIC